MGYSSRFSLFWKVGDRFFTTSPSFLWKEVAHSAGGWLRSHFAFGQPPALRASPFHGKGVDGLLIPLLPPSSGRRWRRAPEIGFALFAFGQPPALRASPFRRKGGDAFHPASPSFLWKEVARSAGGWLSSFRLRPTPCPSGIPLPWEGGRWTTRP